MIFASSIKNSSMDYPSCGQFVLALADHFFMMITSLSRLSIPNLQHWKLIKIPTMLKILLVSIWDPRISKIYWTTKDTFTNRASWIFHQIKGNIESSSFTCTWGNKFNSFMNNPCKVTSFEVTAPKMESSSPSIGVASVKPLKFGFKNQKIATNKSSRVLLSYFATICIIFSYPTNVFTTSSDIKHRSNISANMLWALLAL